MVDVPIILRDPSDRRFDALWLRWVVGLVLTVIAFAWMIFRTDLRREPELPNRPFTAADLPLLKEKVKFLKSDATTASSVFPHLNDPAQVKAANQAWEDLYYTPEIFPAAQELHRIQAARLLELKPDLADHLRAKQAYEEGRYEIANNSAITDKDAAIEALKNKIGPEVEDPEYSKNAKQATAIRPSLVGDPEYDNAEEAYEQACATAILKRHPELAPYYHELEDSDEAYRHFMSEANSLSRQITALENGTAPVPAQVASANVEAPVAAAQANSSAAVSVPLAPVPEAAHRYGVEVGDMVDISSAQPPVAFRSAMLTAMDDDHLTVRDGSDVFNIRWPDVIHLKKAGIGR